ncbi:hypothetical protein OH492_05460 [Vibrio chagasii]|nr:hypothetical protein [Vibrio chagasii]
MNLQKKSRLRRHSHKEQKEKSQAVMVFFHVKHSNNNVVDRERSDVFRNAIDKGGFIGQKTKTHETLIYI